MTEIIYRDESSRTMEACFEVYTEEIGGVFEMDYQECMVLELGDQTIPFAGQPLGLLINLCHYPKVESERIAL